MLSLNTTAQAVCHVNGYVMAVSAKTTSAFRFMHDQEGYTTAYFSPTKSRELWQGRNDVYIFWTRNHSIAALVSDRIADNAPMTLVGNFGSCTPISPSQIWGGEIIDSLVPLN
ncbi:MAG: hypothetical protein ACRD5H_01955 [Nitrososphaerales archaeon]